MQARDDDMPEEPGRDDDAPGKPIDWDSLPVRPDHEEQVLGWTSGPMALAARR